MRPFKRVKILDADEYRLLKRALADPSLTAVLEKDEPLLRERLQVSAIKT